MASAASFWVLEMESLDRHKFTVLVLVTKYIALYIFKSPAKARLRDEPLKFR